MVHFKENPVENNFMEDIDKIGLMKAKDFQQFRLLNQVYEGAEVQGQLPIYCNFDMIGSIQFDKGCFLGQETNARQNFSGMSF